MFNIRMTHSVRQQKKIEEETENDAKFQFPLKKPELLPIWIKILAN